MAFRPFTRETENTLAAQDVIEVGNGSITEKKLAEGAALANIAAGSLTADKLHPDVLAGVPEVYGTGDASYAKRTDRPRIYLTTGDPPAEDVDSGDLRINAS